MSTCHRCHRPIYENYYDEEDFEYFKSTMRPCGDKMGEGMNRSPGKTGQRLMHRDLVNIPLSKIKDQEFIEFSGPGTQQKCFRAGPFEKHFPYGKYAQKVGQWKHAPRDGFFQTMNANGDILSIT